MLKVKSRKIKYNELKNEINQTLFGKIELFEKYTFEINHSIILSSTK